jgi:signal transduction histidine kinase/ActR/RegA family two-component response regulator
METPQVAHDDPSLERLRAELEQAQVALEDAHNETASLVRARDEALETASRQRLIIATAEKKAAELRQELASMVSSASARSGGPIASDSAELRVMLEESTVLAEELQDANDVLLQANRALDVQIAERTDQLDQAMAELERMNADLSRRVDQEADARTAAQGEVFKVQKMEAIGQLTGGIAHDFNNLLTVIISGLQILSHLPEGPRRERLIRRAEEAAWRGADLTRQLLTFARRQPLHPDRVDLTQRFDGLRDLLVHSLRDDIAVSTELEPGLWPVEADIGALELALLNLAVNARDAMPAGGELKVSAQNRMVTGVLDATSSLPQGQYVELTISDAGTGMAPDVLERAFEPFFTTKANSQGAGLGLAQVYGFARQSGGTAWVHSRLGAGTQVHLLLPCSTRPEPKPAPTQARQPGVLQKGPLSVLVVEDDDNVAAAVLDMLAELGHKTSRVASVAAALSILSGAARFDLVFSDVLLPGGGSGLDLAREMSRRLCEAPIILTSGYGGDMTGKLAAANLPFLRKPYQIEALRDAIEEAVHAPSA